MRDDATQFVLDRRCVEVLHALSERRDQHNLAAEGVGRYFRGEHITKGKRSEFSRISRFVRETHFARSAEVDQDCLTQVIYCDVSAEIRVQWNKRRLSNPQKPV